ncbi:unnamed protein product, partial [Amoebophrya sp. A120]|eukprot:GSA120T00011094001.1
MIISSTGQHPEDADGASLEQLLYGESAPAHYHNPDGQLGAGAHQAGAGGGAQTGGGVQDDLFSYLLSGASTTPGGCSATGEHHDGNYHGSTTENNMTRAETLQFLESFMDSRQNQHQGGGGVEEVVPGNRGNAGGKAGAGGWGGNYNNNKGSSSTSSGPQNNGHDLLQAFLQEASGGTSSSNNTTNQQGGGKNHVASASAKSGSDLTAWLASINEPQQPANPLLSPPVTTTSGNGMCFQSNANNFRGGQHPYGKGAENMNMLAAGAHKGSADKSGCSVPNGMGDLHHLQPQKGRGGGYGSALAYASPACSPNLGPAGNPQQHASNAWTNKGSAGTPLHHQPQPFSKGGGPSNALPPGGGGGGPLYNKNSGMLGQHQHQVNNGGMGNKGNSGYNSSFNGAWTTTSSNGKQHNNPTPTMRFTGPPHQGNKGSTPNHTPPPPPPPPP